MRIEDEKGNTLKTVGLAFLATLMVLLLAVLVILMVAFSNRNNSQSTSSEEPSSSEVIPESSGERSEVEPDPYVDIVISNIKKYINAVEKEKLLTDLTVKDIYSINTYTELGSTQLVYGFTLTEETDKYARMIIDLDKELDIEEVISLIHDDKIDVDSYAEYELYEIVSGDITTKTSFKETYPGIYTKHICYKDMSEQYYVSGIGSNDDKYVSIDLLSFNKDTFDIDNTDAHVNETADSGKRYWQALEKLGHVI